MAFCLLASLSGLEGKILQSGIHVWSRFWVRFQGNDTSRIVVIFDVDNTFGTFAWELYEGTKAKTAWLDDFTKIPLVHWYNSTARDSEEIGRIRNLIVSPGAADRIRSQVNRGISQLK